MCEKRKLSRKGISKLLESSSTWKEDCCTMEDQLTNVIRSMIDWIKTVGEPAVEKLDTLEKQLFKKDNDLRMTLVEFECMKDINEELQDELSKRPTRWEYKSETERTARLSATIEKLEQDLYQKDQQVSEFNSNFEQVYKRRKKLECSRDELAEKLRKVKQHYSRELDYETKRYQNLEKALGEKDNELAYLADEMQRIQDAKNEKLFTVDASDYSSSESIILENNFCTPRSWTFSGSWIPESPAEPSCPEDLAAQVEMLDLGGSARTTPQRSPPSSPPFRPLLSLPKFLVSLREIGSMFNLPWVTRKSPEPGECHNWKDNPGFVSTGNDISLNEMLQQLMYALSKYRKEKIARKSLETEIELVEREYQSTIRQLCTMLVEISSAASQPNEPYSLPKRICVRLSHYLPNKLPCGILFKVSSLSLSVQFFIVKKVISTILNLLDGVCRIGKSNTTKKEA